jgi:raffinose/stachyose/melibiose transport system substrate-binding protein
MKCLFPFSQASLESACGSASAETVVKILRPDAISEALEIWQSAAAEYEKAHPGLKVQFDYLEHEEFKAKLPTLLESNDRPSVFFSYSGGVMLEQIQAGVCQDITNAVAGDFKDSFYSAGIQAFMSQGKSYGLPDSVGPIVFWYNRELCEKAGVDPSGIKYWEDLLDAVKKCKAAGVTPMAVGGSEKWPLQFYPALLMMRILGKDGMASAYKGANGGFAGPDVVRAWKMYKELCDLAPFQEGFQTTKMREAAGFFLDGKAVFHLQAGFWVLTAGRMYAADKQGLPDAKLGWLFFPEVQGGKGKANDIFGAVYGWLVSKDAPKDAVDFMKVWLGKDIQRKLAAEGLSIPMVKGTADAIQNPFYKALALEVNHSDWICNAMDQLLGRDTGRVFNDEAAAVAVGAQSPEQATKAIENAWSKNRFYEGSVPRV